MTKRTTQFFVGVLIASVVLAGAYGGYVQAQTQGSKQYQYTVIDPLSPNPEVRLQARQRYIDRAKLLRDHWQTWARENKKVLRQLVHAQPTEIAALQNAYNALPTGLSSEGATTGITDKDLNAPGALYTWQPFGHHQLTRDVKEEFVQQRDIALCDSVSTGRVRYTFWASGRVTETTTMDQFRGRGKPILLYDSVPKEIYPAYDFLQ